MRRYRSFIGDSNRWDGFRFRDDDIVISTPSKSGTTWMQNIVGMLVLGTTEFDRPMGMISPWLDMTTRPLAEVTGLLDAQEHRRFVKTHTPLDGLPRHDRVTYLTVIRHPLQVVRSMEDHLANLDMDRALELRADAVGLDDLDDLPPPPERSDDPAERLRQWILDDTDYAVAGGTSSLRDVVDHARTFWDARHRPNVHLFHYSDLRRDLDGEMRRVASILGVPGGDDRDRWDEFVAAAGFESMRARSAQLAPDTHFAGFWRSTDDFFRQAERATELDDDDQQLFEERIDSLAGPALAAWMCHGALP